MSCAQILHFGIWRSSGPCIIRSLRGLMLVDKTPAPGNLKGPGRSMPSTGAATDAPKEHKLVSANNVEPQGLLQSSINMLYTSSPIVVYTLACATGLLNIGRLLANVPGVHQKVHDLALAACKVAHDVFGGVVHHAPLGTTHPQRTSEVYVHLDRRPAVLRAVRAPGHEAGLKA